MKTNLCLVVLITLITYTPGMAQKSLNEDKINKAVVLMQKMMTDPGQMQTVLTELAALQLSSAENKEAKNRMQQTALDNAGNIKQEVTQKGNITEKQIKAFKENKDRMVPERNEAKIGTVLKRNLADAEIKNYCKAVHETVKKVMNPHAVEQAEKIYTSLKAKNTSAAAMANGAISCYLSNLTLQSIYILGKVCSDDAGNANSLNNYAALLTNYGAEPAAIPILNYLNKKYPRSPVVMSNLSLSWMGIGELKMAEKYADSCIRFFPGNAAQAYYVKAVVSESEGNRQSAVAELKQSIGERYSAEKESVLRKIGGKLISSDYKKQLPEDALGLSKFHFPVFPKNYEAAVNGTSVWETFYKNLKSSISELEIKTGRLRKAYEAKGTADAKAAVNASNQKNVKGNYAFAANNNTNQSWNGFFDVLSNEFFKKEEAFLEEAKRLTEKQNKMKDELDVIIKGTLAKRFEQDATGKKFKDEEACNAYLTAYDNFMLPANTLLENFNSAYIEHKRKMTNQLVYAAKQFMDDDYYAYYASNSKLQFLYNLQAVRYEMPNYALGLPYAQSCINVKQHSFTNKGMARWEDVNCQPDWSAKLGTASLSTHCNKITLSADLLFGQGSYTADVVTGEWTDMTLEIGGEIGSREIKGAGVSAGAGAFICIDRRGISDFGVKGTIGSSNGIVNAEAEAKISLMSGKASFDTKAGSDLDRVAVAFK